MTSQREITSRRAILLLVFIGLLFIVVLGRFFYITLFFNGQSPGRIISQSENIYKEQPRGEIIDSRGNIFATTVLRKSLAANPERIKHPRKIARSLSSILGMNREELHQQLTRNKKFVWLKRKLKQSKVETLQKYKNEGLFLVSEHERVYPQEQLAAPVIGFTGVDNQGLAGVEQNYDQFLSREAENSGDEKNSSQSSADVSRLQLTIDQRIQHIVEEELQKTVEKTQPTSAMVVVLDPKTGFVRAMANWPSFNPNKYSKFSADHRSNRAITDVFEPGSTLKAMNMAIGLTSDSFSWGTTYNDKKGYIYLPEARATIHDYAIHGEVAIHDILIQSCNVGAVKAVNDISSKTYFKSLRKFGFGMETGINLPGESSGAMRPPSKWSALTQANMAIGQGISTTALQMTNAYAAIANNGNLMKPRIIKTKKPAYGPSNTKKPFKIRQVIPKPVAQEIRNSLEDVVRKGTGEKAFIQKYRLAGKTGTAQVPDTVNGGYYEDKVLASFIGFGPLPNPGLVTGVFIENPKNGKYGGEVAAPLFRRIMERSLDLLG